jgi:hypothetical protein
MATLLKVGSLNLSVVARGKMSGLRKEKELLERGVPERDTV